jgi:hypothetical protein
MMERIRAIDLSSLVTCNPVGWTRGISICFKTQNIQPTDRDSLIYSGSALNQHNIGHSRTRGMKAC